jgi:hypothetical protein
MKLSLAPLVLIAFAAIGCAGSSSSEDVAAAQGEVSAQKPITLGNWLTHPKIVAVRDIVNEIDASKYASESKTGLCADSGHGESERTKVTDDKGVIRELVLAFGSEDSATIESHYYDAKGKLRFIFTTHNDVHGNSEELRTYFDETGARIWDVRRHAFSESFNPDLERAPYEAVATENEAPLDPAVLTPAVRFDAPEQCD